VGMSTIKDMDAVILAVAHTEFSNFKMAEMDKFFGEGKKVLLDLKGLLNLKEYEAAGYSYWRL
jgi:UDP-N-acetyl-D-galactosamine dehydrogenase